MLYNRVLSQWRAGSLQLTPYHLPWVAPLLVHLSPHLIAQQWWTPGNMLLLRTPKLEHLVCPAGGVMGVVGRSTAACIAAIVETKCVLIGKGHDVMPLRREVGQLTQLLPCSVGGWWVKMRGSLLLPLQTWQHWLCKLKLLTSSHGPITKEFIGMV